MESFIGSVVLSAPEAGGPSAFWRDALSYVSQWGAAEILVPPDWAPPSNTRLDHGAMHVHLDSGDRVHLDLGVGQRGTLDSEVERLIALGARRVEWTYPDNAHHGVLADPAGNLFGVCA